MTVSEPPDPLAQLRGLIQGLDVELDSLRRAPTASRPSPTVPEPPAPPRRHHPDPVEEVAPEPPVRGEFTRRLAWAALAAALLLALFAAESGLLDRSREHALPTSHPSALVWSGKTLWIADWFDQSVYRMIEDSQGLRLERRYQFPKSHIMALAVSDRHVFIADSWAKQIQRRKIDEALTLEAAIASPGPNPSALFYDGRYLWSADKNTRRLYQHALDNELTVLGDYPLGYAPVGFHIDRTGLWAAGEEPRLFYRHAPPRGLETLGVYELPELLEGRAPISGFAWRERKLWIALDGVNKILERPARKLKRRRAV